MRATEAARGEFLVAEWEAVERTLAMVAVVAGGLVEAQADIPPQLAHLLARVAGAVWAIRAVMEAERLREIVVTPKSVRAG